MFVLSETKGKGECEFGYVIGRSGLNGECVVEWKEMSSRRMWVKVKFNEKLWVFVSAYGPGIERAETER